MAFNMMSIEAIKNQKILNMKKALTYTQGTSTVIPEFIPPIVHFLAAYQNPLRQNLPRINQDGGDSYLVLRDTGATCSMLAPEAEPNDDTGSDPTEHRFYYKRPGTSISVGKFRRSVSGGSRGIDLYVQKLTNAIFNLKNLEDQQYTVADGTGQNMYGLKYLIENDSTTRVLAGSCDAGNTITAKMVDEAMDLPGSYGYYPTMILSSPTIRREFQALLQDQQRFVNMTTVNGGFQLMTYNGAAYYVSSNMLVTQNYTYSGGCEGAETGGTTGSMYFINPYDVFISILDNVDLRLTKRFQSETIYDGTDILCYETLVVRNNKHVSKLIGLGYS